jgi:fucose 4-O-acetylase-like acetyltransferase
VAKLDGHFFFLGAAFMLLEVRGITQLSLAFGSTWFVNSAVISAVLAAILLANWFVARFRPEKLTRFYVLLLLAIPVSYFLPVGRLLGLPFWLRGGIASLTVAVPIFLAGVIFATSFRRTSSPEAAFGSNLLGAVLGGLGEYLSLLCGVRALCFVIMAFYALSAWFARRRMGHI